jgi:hypothetical protein
MTVVLWSLDSQDWKRHVPPLEGLHSVSPSVQQTFPGMRGVFLFHDTHRQTVAEMADILDALIDLGCERFVTVSEYMAKAPREEGHRLSTCAPREGYGIILAPTLARGLSGSTTQFKSSAPFPLMRGTPPTTPQPCASAGAQRQNPRLFSGYGHVSACPQVEQGQARCKSGAEMLPAQQERQSFLLTAGFLN